MAKKQSQSVQIPVPEFVASGLASSKEKVQEVGEQAETLLRDLMERGNSSVEEIKGRLGVEEVLDRAKELELRTRGKAEDFSGELERRLRELQEKAMGLVGLVTRDEVNALSKDIAGLTRKVEKIARTLKADLKPAVKSRKSSSGSKAKSKNRASKTRA